MITWPTTLPLPTVDGYGLSPGDAILRTDMESGLARQRRRFTAVPTVISVRWMMTRHQFAVFESWYKIYAQEGASFFDIDLLGGIGLTIHNARFIKQFNAKLRNNLWILTSQLEVRERPVLNQETLDFLTTNPPTETLNTLNQLEKLVNETLPNQF